MEFIHESSTPLNPNVETFNWVGCLIGVGFEAKTIQENLVKEKNK
jgi:hypothetical protein